MTDKIQQGRIYRDRVLKCITSRPGDVVYRDDIVQETDLPEDKIVGCMGQLLRDDNPLSSDIKVVVPGRAWQYVPNKTVQRAARIGKPDPRIVKAIEEGRPLPLTHRIREYFAANERRVVYLDELHRAVNTPDAPVTEEQVRIGISNARINHPTFKEELSIVTPGKAWMFSSVNGNHGVDPVTARSAVLPPSSSTTTPVPTPQSVAAHAPTPTPPTDSDDDQMLLLEPLGTSSDGGALYRDENKNVYRVYRL